MTGGGSNWVRATDVDAIDQDADVDVHSVATDGKYFQVDGDPTPFAVEDFDVSVDSDLDLVRSTVLERERRDWEHSFSIELDLDPTDSDDRALLAFLSELFAGD